MKKFLKTLTLSIAVAFMGIFCLVGCGNQDEFSNAEKITSDALSTYVQSSTSEFSGYQMKMNVTGVDMIDATVVIDQDTNDMQIAMNFNFPAEIIEEGEDVTGSIYLKDNIVYFNYMGQKLKTAYDPTSADFEELQQALMFSGDLKDLILENLTDVNSDNLSIKMLTEENTTKFLIEVKEWSDYGMINYSMKLVYEDDALIELVETTKVGKDVLSLITIKAYSGAVTFPEGLAEDESYTEA
ncbi:MAG: hypothetical protein ACI4R8_03575 [Candidatus Caccovivens sp.]